ncbi:carbonic anhydrase, partial [Belliella pelovolcani]
MRSFIYVIFLIILAVSCKSEQLDQHLENVPKENLLNVLLAGNERFSEDHPIHPDQTLARLRDLSVGQHPVAAIVSCSDSRVPPELIFDQGLGDLFVIRNAG